MKSYRARVEVKLKPGYSDPEGESVRKALVDLKYQVERASTGKVYEIKFRASSLKDAERKIGEMCRRLLANPVKDDFVFEIEEI